MVAFLEVGRKQGFFPIINGPSGCNLLIPLSLYACQCMSKLKPVEEEKNSQKCFLQICVLTTGVQVLHDSN